MDAKSSDYEGFFIGIMTPKIFQVCIGAPTAQHPFQLAWEDDRLFRFDSLVRSRCHHENRTDDRTA